MRLRTRVVLVLAAAASLTLSACSSPGQQSAGTTAPVTDANGSVAASSATVPSDQGSSGSATPSTGDGADTSSDSGCGKPHGPYDDPGQATGAVTFGYNQLGDSWNNLTTHGNSTYNGIPNYLTQAQPFYYDRDLNLINNDQFITCELVSKNPLTIKYAINKAAKWSDGVPVTAADLVLPWIALSGKYDTGELKTDDNGVPLPDQKVVAFDGAGTGYALIKNFPEISEDQRSVTFTYSKPFVDYDVNITPGVPAHVVGQKALGVSDATAATAALLKAAKDDDKAALVKVANFWNTGFDFTSLPSDKSLYLSDGAYLMTDFKEGQYMTLEANPDYTWGPKPTVKTFTIQYAPDPTAAVQSLANGELQIINPQATEDVLKGLTALKDQGIETINGNAALWEHVDLVFTNGGPFDPKSYSGDEAKARAVRTAFLKSIPRQDIVDRLIKPLNPDASVRNSYNIIPGSPNYDAVTKADGMEAAHDGDIAGAKKILADAGIDTSTPIKVRLMYADNNPRRANEYRLIAAAAKEAGFDVIDGKDASWSTKLPTVSAYDASLFGWISTSTGAGQIPPQYLGKVDGKWAGQNNYGQYNDENVNTWMNELNVTTDPAKQLELIKQLEAQLVKDGFGTVLFNHPDIVGYDSKRLTGVNAISLSPSPVHNYWEWKVTG